MKLYEKTWKLFLIVVALGAMVSCGKDTASNTSNDEVVKYLKEIHTEIVLLRKDIDKLKVAGVARKNNQPEKVPDSVKIGDALTIGNQNARVAIVEFSDYQCPFCARFYQSTFNAVKSKYIDSGKVLFAYRDFPLSSHAMAKPASVAARCAGAQGAYWVMQRELFKNQSRLSYDTYTEIAKEMKLDVNKFIACTKDSKQQKIVEKEFEYGRSIGVNGTPTFYIGLYKNGVLTSVERLGGAQPEQAFALVIEKLLKKTKG